MERISLLAGSEEVIEASLASIDAAREEVLLAMYWLGDDDVGKRVLDALGRAAERGVTTRLSVDGFGSILLGSARLDELRARGAEALVFHPLSPFASRFAPDSVTVRDHRKLLVIDRARAIVGGVNFAQPPGPPWRDYAACVESPRVARLLARHFFTTWRRSGGAPPASPPPREARSPKIEVLAAGGLHHARAVRLAYLVALRAARRTVLIEHAYFVPDRAVLQAILRAAKRGLEVRVVLPEWSDVTVVSLASHAIVSRLQRAGAHVHLLRAPILHAKAAVIDGWATVGSANLDHVSLRNNLELNVATHDPAFVAALTREIRADIARSGELSRETWKARPLLRRFAERAAYQFRKLL
ncbi:MAG: phosphatidylserine/phosphatidylglycerophosphate/cardiolipin synthase family protein [Polyangiaceae bacterium]|nr:phosphatidylserine/phosphatidylglycerophosphate/cardiolipin synthase family protein [Polyangiaceae bacterium]